MTSESIIAIDLGGTKCAGAIVEKGRITQKSTHQLKGATGDEVYDILAGLILEFQSKNQGSTFKGIGVSVPGIARKTGEVWAPNIPGWDDYPLQERLSEQFGIPVHINSDRSCAIRGEAWVGAATGIDHAIYVAVGTGIGAGIMIDGQILEGAQNIAGAIGWLALDGEYKEGYETYGNFEYNASGDGLARVAGDLLSEKGKQGPHPTSKDIFNDYDQEDPLARQVMGNAIKYWGRAVANLISIFNPQMMVMGGGVFGPATRFIPEIQEEAKKWAQPISFEGCQILPSQLGNDALLYGAAKLVMDHA